MIFFLLALLPILVWGIQWYFNKEVVWQEAVAGAGAALLVAAIFWGIQAEGVFVPSDTETWSGRVYYAQYQPPWLEYYEYAVYRTETYECGTSKQPQTCTREVFDHWEPSTRWHDKMWWVNTELGMIDINVVRYNDIVNEFGEVTHVPGCRETSAHNSRMLQGPRDDDHTVNRNNYVYPITKNMRFENRLLKAKDSLYSFEPLTEEESKPLYLWPHNGDKFDSDRLLGTATTLWNGREWDQMNAVLGPTKKVNLVAIGFPHGTAMELGMRQQQYWKGGKKNDLVLTFGGDPQKPDWAYVFGWTEHETVKRLLENRLRDGTATIAEITHLVRDEYSICHFEEKFKHVEIETPWWYYLIFGVVVIGTQTAAHIIFTRNEYSKVPRYYR